MPFVEANGINIYYEVRGSGRPLLLILGLGIDVTQAETLVDGLGRSRRVIAFDNRGVGRTDKPDTIYSTEMLAEDAAGLLSALSVDTCDVLGFSMGGRVAIALCTTYPELVQSLVLAVTSAKVVHRGGVIWTLSDFLLRFSAVRAIGTRYPQPYYAYVRQREASSAFDATSRLRMIQVPTLVIQARSDRIVPARMVEELHAGIQGSTLAKIDAGTLLSSPDQVNLLNWRRNS